MTQFRARLAAQRPRAWRKLAQPLPEGSGFFIERLFLVSTDVSEPHEKDRQAAVWSV